MAGKQTLRPPPRETAFMHWHKFVLTFFLLSMTLATAAAPPAAAVADSTMTTAEAFAGLSPRCPPALRDRQALVAVEYWGFDEKLHRGQLVIDADLVADVQAVFAVAREHRFPLQSVIPVSHPRFRKDGAWSDDLSMAANNTSGFNYRPVTGGTSLSRHALGRAIDVNPLQNPYVKGDVVLPPGARYDRRAPGTLTADHPVTKAFLARGWDWGGHWHSLKDYQHFEKPLRDTP
jgi:peptidoglycan L-alanyl-D-glutamate endopeptidase CwlK